MYVSRVSIKNYANFKDLDVRTSKDVVIVGENKVGKSNFVRALQLVLDPGISDRDRYLGLEHFWDGLANKLGESVEVAIEFSDFEDEPQLLAILGDCLVETDPMVSRLTYRFQPKASLTVAPASLADYEYIIFGGTNEENMWLPSDRRQMPLDVQGALRNAEADLMAWARSPLRPLIEDLTMGLGEEDRQEIQALIDSNQNELARRPEIQTAAQTISTRLSTIVGDQHAVPVDLGLAPMRVDGLLRGLRILIDNGARGIPDASLGTANLLFLALKSLELDRLVADGERSHTFFVVEEPEAHLHPHVQRLVYRHFLASEEQASREGDAADTVTTILTTHSPHIASVAPVRSVVLLRHDAKVGATVGASTASVELSAVEEADLQRYIDVTRGELFFARGIVFVEGDAERFLLPAFARAIGLDLDVLGITVCSVSGTNFSPYLKLVSREGLNIPFVVLTDLDPRADGKPPYGVDRVRGLLKVLDYRDKWVTECAQEPLLREGEHVGIFVNDSTLEVELFDAGLGTAMLEVFGASLPFGATRRRVLQGWIDDPDTLDEGQLLSWIEQIGKGRFAQAIASHVDVDTCPDYVSGALRWIANAVTPD